MDKEVEIPLQAGVVGASFFGGRQIAKHIGKRVEDRLRKKVEQKSIKEAIKNPKMSLSKIKTRHNIRMDAFNKGYKIHNKTWGRSGRLWAGALAATAALGMMNKKRINDFKASQQQYNTQPYQYQEQTNHYYQ